MIKRLGHIGIRLWITALLSVPLTFYLLSGWDGLKEGAWTLAAASGTVALVYCGIDRLLDWIGRTWISALLAAGRRWENLGLDPRADRMYVRAWQIFDGFLLSFSSAGKMENQMRRIALRLSSKKQVDADPFSIQSLREDWIHPAHAPDSLNTDEKRSGDGGESECRTDPVGKNPDRPGAAVSLSSCFKQGGALLSSVVLYMARLKRHRTEIKKTGCGCPGGNLCSRRHCFCRFHCQYPVSCHGTDNG